MEQSNNPSTILCPSCKSENPNISVCLTCGAKITREQLNAKDLISRPVLLTVIAGMFMLLFILRALTVSWQKDEAAVVSGIIHAIFDISLAYGLWQLKKWAWLVIVISCSVSIVLLWTPLIIFWLHPPSLKLFIPIFTPSSFHIFAKVRYVPMTMKAFLNDAILWTMFYGSMLKYFFSSPVRNIFSDNPVIWKSDRMNENVLDTREEH